MKTFLQAEWRKLAMANYRVDPKILAPYLPYKTEIDFWNNTCYVSLVGFMFLNTKMLGVKNKSTFGFSVITECWPFHCERVKRS
jgi:uncharacterized protein YqjF (DUF2071 family)